MKASWLAVILAVLAPFACSESSDDPVTEAGSQVEASIGCPPLNDPPAEGDPCSEPGLVCEIGMLSCWKKATCAANLQWHITCGIMFPDGGPCC